MNSTNRKCIDEFHVVPWAIEAMATLRKELWHAANKEKASNLRKIEEDLKKVKKQIRTKARNMEKDINIV